MNKEKEKKKQRDVLSESDDAHRDSAGTARLSLVGLGFDHILGQIYLSAQLLELGAHLGHALLGLGELSHVLQERCKWNTHTYT